ncbi:MAG: hypothetical protein GEU88_09550 [Solirubrobacterales bacterium]|nr:hypothetical protein [Solirubrobacterales bacterium]
MANAAKIEIGFDGGQVVSVRLAEDRLGELRRAVESPGGWFDLETDEGSFALDLGKVVFVRGAGGPHSIGFSGD